MAIAASTRDFLRLLSYRQAFEQGVKVDDKSRHALITEVAAQTTLANAKDHKLFAIGDEVPGISYLSAEDIKRELEFLVKNNVFAQLFYIEFHADQNTLGSKPCFIAFSDEDPVKLDEIYEAIVEESGMAIQEFLQRRPPPDKDDFNAAMDFDLKSAQAKGTIFLSVDSLLEPTTFSIPLSKAVAADLTHEALRLAVGKRLVLEVPGYGLVAADPERRLLLAETAHDFLKQHLVNRFQHNPELNQQLEEIYIEETMYKEQPRAAPTLKFAERKAQAIRPFLRKDVGDDKPYKGGLATEIILKLAPELDEALAQRHHTQLDGEFKELKSMMQNATSHWSKLLLIYEQDELEAMGEQFAQWLRDDGDLAQVIWQLPESTVECFAAKDKYTFRTCIDTMVELEPGDRWKILVLRALVENAEDQIESAFKDKSFVKAYGKILRIAYMDHMPWFLRPFIMMGIGFLQDLGFKLAKGKIENEQQRLARRNEARRTQNRKQSEMERQRREDKLQNLELRSTINEKLDTLYNKDKFIPSIKDIGAALDEVEEDRVLGKLKSHQFQLVTVGADTIPLFPMDQHWRSMAGRTMKSIEEILEKLSDIDLNEADAQQKERAEAVQKFIKKSL